VNKVGASDWSPESVLIPAVVPSAPPKPKFISADSTAISLQFLRSQDNGGQTITDYELQVKQSDSGVYATVTAYDFAVDGFSYTIVASDNSMTPGNLYTFKIRSLNSLGNSDFSDSLTVGLVELPSQLTAPIKASEGNSETSISLEWSELSGQTLEVLKYSLYVDDGFGVSFTKVMDEKQAQFTVNNL
jgi:hypothetical protein